jgi:hypothetical protein
MRSLGLIALFVVTLAALWIPYSVGPLSLAAVAGPGVSGAISLPTNLRLDAGKLVNSLGAK